MSEEMLHTETVSPKKRIQGMSIDRLSALPESLIIHILSFLKTKEAAITAMLSKRWQFLWTELPGLLFEESSNDSEKVRKFVARVHRTLINCRRNNLETFMVDFWYNNSLACDVDAWIEFAVKKKSKKVCLLLNSVEHSHRLTQIIYSNSSLTDLLLRGCEMPPRKTIEWPFLTELKMEDVVLNQHLIEEILSCCPVLRYLLLKNCQGFDCLKVNSPSLNKLEVWDNGDADDPLLEISAPFIHTLFIWLSRTGRRLQVTNLPSVVRARIDVNDLSDWDQWDAVSIFEELIMSNLKQLFENVLHVKELELGFESTEFLSTLVGNGWQVPQSKRRCLKVNAYYVEKSIPGIVSLLESSPNIETLVIKGFDYRVEPVLAVKGDLVCNLLHLKNVQITDFAGVSLLKLAEILLKRAVVLEKMLIEFDSTEPAVAESNLSEIVQTLLSYPRSSQNAVSFSINDRATLKYSFVALR